MSWELLVTRDPAWLGPQNRPVKPSSPGLSEVTEEGAEEFSTMQLLTRVQQYSGPEEPLQGNVR